MLKLTYSKENINVNKLHSELGQLSDSYSLTHNDVEFNLIFPDLKKTETDILDKTDNIIGTNTTYQKRFYQTVMETDDDEKATEKQVEKWEDYTTEVEALISGIEQVITNHDPQDKEAIIETARIECNKRILSGFDSDCLGVTKHFDCDYTDQSTIQGLVITAMLGLQGLTTEKCEWKASGELECYEFTYEQIIILGTDMKTHIQTNINQFNTERMEILNE
jgi:uncharacterized protein YutD